jgi:hypothetical protein
MTMKDPDNHLLRPVVQYCTVPAWWAEKKNMYKLREDSECGVIKL